MVLGDDLCGKAAPFFASRRVKVNLPRSQIGWDLGPASRYTQAQAGCDGVPSRGLVGIGAAGVGEWATFSGRLFPPRRDKAELKTVDISRASRSATRKR